MADFSDPKGDYNPYAPPTSNLQSAPGKDEDEMVLPAERGTRWWARLCDNLLLLLASVPAIVTFATDSSALSRGFDPPAITYALGLLPLALIVYQWVLLSTRGQTLGKRWLGIKVIRLDGSPVGFVYGVLLREWVLSGAALIPYLGNMVGLVDALMIFGADRRCLHDHIAGTRVVMTLGTR